MSGLRLEIKPAQDGMPVSVTILRMMVAVENFLTNCIMVGDACFKWGTKYSETCRKLAAEGVSSFSFLILCVCVCVEKIMLYNWGQRKRSFYLYYQKQVIFTFLSNPSYEIKRKKLNKNLLCRLSRIPSKKLN